MDKLKISMVLPLSFLCVVLTSCTSINGAVGSYFGMDTDLQVDFVVDADINPDESGKASPLFIRMYELATPKMMARADFIEIYERDKEALGEDMVAVHKLKRFKPGESRSEHYVLNKKANYVAFYAEFLKFKGAKYKVIIPVVASNLIDSTAVVHVSGNKITVEHKDGSDYREYYDGENIKAGAGHAKEAAESAQGIYDKAQGL
jgi:type VI secretion system protein VasD